MIIAFIAVGGLIFIAWLVEFAGGHSGQVLIGIVVPYAAFAFFLAGFVWKVLGWMKVPVPFRIPTTCGQQESLPWIKQSKLEAPSGTPGVVARMLLEVFFFRSLLRNTKSQAADVGGPRLAYQTEIFLWLAGLAFHYTFLVVFLRHFRLFVSQVPFFVPPIEALDGWVQLTLPTFYMSGGILVLAAGYLFIRRLFNPQVKYISLAADYFPLLLILSIAISGILLRYVIKTDVVATKAFLTSLFNLSPKLPDDPDAIGYMVFIHIFLVSALVAYFPVSKLMHMGGVFLSPTRNLANNSRRVRHINPWNDPNIKPHSYEDYEDDFRKAMKSVGLPLEKDEE
jgi:nitrate reductase gamma subunit